MTGQSQDNSSISEDTRTPKKSWQQRMAAVGVIVFLLAMGISVSLYLVKTKPQAKRKHPAKMQALVTTIKVAPITTNVRIKALGRIIPAQEITLQARVSGKAVYLHPDLVPGGIVTKEKLLVKLDDIDYKLVLQNKQTALARAKADRRIEEGNQLVAEQEWELIKRQSEDIDASTIDLALRKPQLEKVKAAVEAAQAEVDRAEVDLKRTRIRAPFNAVVREKNIDLGSQISGQSPIAVLTGIDTFWAEISVPVAKLAWIKLPGAKKRGSEVRVYADGAQPYKGKIVNLLPDLDPDGLMARLLIAVPDPMGLKSNGKPLLLGSFVRVEIIGKKIKNVFRIPRASLKENDTVLLAAEDETLHIQPVSVRWKNTSLVFIDQGLKAGDRVIVSNLAAPIEGMPLQVAGDAPEKASGAGEGKGNAQR